jgi:hypothetical protein
MIAAAVAGAMLVLAVMPAARQARAPRKTGAIQVRVTGGRTSEHLACVTVRGSETCTGWMRRYGVRFQSALRGTLQLGRTNSFSDGDLSYLANLCHNCGECLYACQYAPPHEFAVNVPRTLAQIRLRSYEEYSWPGGFSEAFEQHSVLVALGLSIGLTVLMLAVVLAIRVPVVAAVLGPRSTEQA